MEGIKSAWKACLSWNHKHLHQLLSCSFVSDARSGAQSLFITHS